MLPEVSSSVGPWERSLVRESFLWFLGEERPLGPVEGLGFRGCRVVGFLGFRFQGDIALETQDPPATNSDLF